MSSSSLKGALIFASLPIALFTSGCGGMGEAGFHDVVAGNWDAARVEFKDDYRGNPEHPVAVFNMGATYHHDGDINQADAMFSEAVIRGKDHIPDNSLEPPAAGPTVADYACARLHRDNKLDTNCGDQIAMVTPPAPPPVAQAAPEPAPAVEAQATTPPPAPMPPKQDRN